MRTRDEPSPRPLLDKLGVKPGMRAAVVGRFSGDFLAQLRARLGEIVAQPDGCGLVFLAVEDRAHLVEIERVVRCLRHDAALWVVRPRGSALIGEREVLAAGLTAGVVDVKVVYFSDTHSAAKFVFRVADR